MMQSQMNSDSMRKTFLIINAVSSVHVSKGRSINRKKFHIIFNLIALGGASFFSYQ